MKPLWKGAISFGLVNIPVGLYSATQRTRTIDLTLLRDSDHSRIRYKKVAEADGREVPLEHIVKGYEYERNRYVALSREDFARVQIKSNQLVDIQEFVQSSDIDPRLYDTPYFLAPEKGGDKAFVLLRQALEQTGLAGVAKVVIRPPREHLALLKPLDGLLLLQTLHFADELRNSAELRPPQAELANQELDMAVSLINTMTAKWKPGEFHDEYRAALLQLVEEKVRTGGKAVRAPKAAPAAKGQIIDLVDLLQQSLGKTGQAPARKAPRRSPPRRKAA